MRLLNICVLAMLVFAAAYVYEIKFESTLRAERIAKMRGDIRRERDAVAALRAEWATLENPARIQGLVRRHLPLGPTHPAQFDSLDRSAGTPAADRAAAAGGRDRLDDRKSGQRSADRLHSGGRPAAGHAAGQGRLGRWTRSHNPQTRRMSCKPAEHWRRRLIRTLLYGENVNRHAKARARVGLAILAFAAVYTVIAAPPRHVRGVSGKPRGAPRRRAGARLDRAARHRRPQRPDPRDRRARAVAVRRAAPHHRSRRSDRTAHRGAARSRRAGIARPAQHQEGLHLAQARDHAQAAARDSPARLARRRLPGGEQARLSEQRRGLAPDRPRQHRQPGHRRHREMARRPRPAGAAHGGLRHRPAATADRTGGRPARPARGA